MASTVPPKKNEAYTFETALVSQANVNVFQTTVTLAAGDVTVYQDGVLDGNIDTLPTEIGATGILVVALSAAEMNADRIAVLFRDQAGAEWQDKLHTIETVTDIQMDDIADAVWDEVLTGATHNVSSSAGKRLREVAGNVITSGTAQASTSNTITLAADASAVDGAYDPSLIYIVAGTGIGQSRLILEYTGSTRIAVVDRNWKANPDATSDYIITGHPGREHVNEGLAQAGSTSTTIKLNALASSDDDAYNNQLVFIRSGTGEDQARIVTDYDGTTKVATIDRTWDTTPDATSAYIMIPSHSLTSTAIGTAVWASATRTLSDAATVWAQATRTLTQSAASVTATVSGDTVTITRGDSLSASITGLGDISGRSKLWFTVKSDRASADSAAIIQIEETAGLVYLNGADASARAAKGDITIDNATSGNITITLDETEADDLVVQNGLYYDVQMLTTAGAVTTLTSGTCNVSADVTRTVA